MTQTTVTTKAAITGYYIAYKRTTANGEIQYMAEFESFNHPEDSEASRIHLNKGDVYEGEIRYPNWLREQMTTELPEAKNKKEDVGDVERCICCGRKVGENPKYVHMNTCGKVLAPWIDEEFCAELTGWDSQGCFPIGNECAKKISKFTFTYQ